MRTKQFLHTAVIALVGVICFSLWMPEKGGATVTPEYLPALAQAQEGVMKLITASYDGSECLEGGCYPMVFSINENGQYLVIGASDQDRLLEGDTNGTADVFLFDRVANTMEAISVNDEENFGNGYSYDGRISADGQTVAFESTSSNLTDLHPIGYGIYLRDRSTGQTELASVASDGVTLPNAECYDPVLSSDGNVVAFISQADNLDEDTYPGFDIFVHERQSGLTELVSKSTEGVQGRVQARYPVLSSTGRFVAFCSATGLLVNGDTNGVDDVFVRDRLAGTTERVSVTSTGAQVSAGACTPVGISADGRYVTFYTWAQELINTGDFSALVRKDRLTGQVQTLFGFAYGSDSLISLSTDMRFAVMYDGYRIYWKDLTFGPWILITAGYDGEPADGKSSLALISGDGQYVLFASDASNLVPGDDDFYCDPYAGYGESNCGDVFLWEPVGVNSTISSNYSSGQPGSFFTITGERFPTLTTLNVLVNDAFLGNVTSDSAGNIKFLLESASADEGYYLLEVQAPLSGFPRTLALFIDSSAPLRSQEGEGIIFHIPPGIAKQRVFLPVLRR